jgi:hypothetical protein
MPLIYYCNIKGFFLYIKKRQMNHNNENNRIEPIDNKSRVRDFDFKHECKHDFISDCTIILQDNGYDILYNVDNNEENWYND